MATILVPLDGSERSTQAMPYADAFARLLGAQIVLLHVVTSGDEQDFMIERERVSKIATPAGPVPAGTERAAEQYADSYLEQQAEQLRAQGVDVRAEIAHGAPAQGIVAAAERLGATMIVIATHGRGTIGRWLIGSVAHKVIRLTPVPVLATRQAAPAGLALRRIIVPLDGSALAREALPMAIDLARRAQATLVLLTVLAPRYGLDPAVLPPPNERELQGIRERLFHELDALVAECRDVQITTAVGEGFVSDTICREAEGQQADLIVMTTHGYTGPRGLALGSVTDKVLHDTHVPVLIIPHRKPEDRTERGEV